jgi:hypothetical protein
MLWTTWTSYTQIRDHGSVPDTFKGVSTCFSYIWLFNLRGWEKRQESVTTYGQIGCASTFPADCHARPAAPVCPQRRQCMWWLAATITSVGRGGRCPIHSFYFPLFSFLIPAENAPKQTQDLVLKSLDPKFSLLYIQPTPERLRTDAWESMTARNSMKRSGKNPP